MPLTLMAPLITFLTYVPATLGVMWIANRWITSRHADNELKKEVEDLKHVVGEMQERLDFTERWLSQERERRDLPPAR
jgi:hypothetical protein